MSMDGFHIPEDQIGFEVHGVPVPRIKFEIMGAAKHAAGGWPDLQSLCRKLGYELDGIGGLAGGAEKKQSVSDLAGEILVSLEREIGRQLSVVMTHPLFAHLEAAWRGLETLVEAHETYFARSVGVECDVEMADVSASELNRDLADPATITSSWLRKTIDTDRLDTRGGRPFGMLIGGMEFGGETAYSSLHRRAIYRETNPCSITLLHRIGIVAERAFCPFIAAASPKLLGFRSDFSQMIGQDVLHIASAEDVDGTVKGKSASEEWKELRRNSASRFIGLVAPRIVLAGSLSRRTNRPDWFGWPAQSNDDRELEIARLSFQPLLGSGAYALGAIVIRSVFSTGWPSSILGVSTSQSRNNVATVDGEGHLEDADGLVILRGDSFSTDPQGVSVRAPVEVALTGEQERQIGQLGLLALSRITHTDRAAFYTLRMAHLPDYTDNVTVNATEELHAILPYILTASRFAQFAKIWLWRKHGTFNSAADLKMQLNDILANNFVGDARPLSKIEVTVEQTEVGVYACNLQISPRLMVEDVQIDGAIAFRLTVQGKLKSITEDTNPPL